MPTKEDASRVLSVGQAIRGFFWAMLVLMMLALRDLFPDSTFVQTYFNGPAGLMSVFWIGVVMVVGFYVERTMLRRRRARKGEETQ